MRAFSARIRIGTHIISLVKHAAFVGGLSDSPWKGDISAGGQVTIEGQVTLGTPWKIEHPPSLTLSRRDT